VNVMAEVGYRYECCRNRELPQSYTIITYCSRASCAMSLLLQRSSPPRLQIAPGVMLSSDAEDRIVAKGKENEAYLAST
jgi:hypothetical protein